MKRLNFITLVWLFLLSIFVARGEDDKDREQLIKFNQFYSLLSKYYIDELESEQLIERAIRSVLGELDPHSVYYNAEDMKSIRESFEGEFSGVGIEFNVIDDTLRVVNTIVGAPAEKVGVMANDRIIRIDTTSIIGITQGEVPKRLRGEKGSRVDIDVIRHGYDEPLHFSIIRDNIPINTIDAAYKLNSESGYIRVNRFAETTMKEFREAYKGLGDVENLVVDLRGNGGGLLTQAVEMANFFLPKGLVVVTTQGDESREVRTTTNGEFLSGNVVIMIDGSSASASEIVAGAIQDWDRGVIVGKRSFGKGLVQRQYPLADGSAVRITTSRYLTPSGRAIQRPYTKGDNAGYYSHPEDRADQNDSLKFKTLRLGRDVYSGGGITPDIEIEGDTTKLSAIYTQFIRRGVVNKFTISYLDRNRKEIIRTYPTFELYNEAFDVTGEMVDSMVQIAKEQGIEVENIDTLELLQESRVYIKALIAQRLFSTSAFYEIINRKDLINFSRIEKLLKNWDEQINEVWHK
ncbi:MAG: S41 family peptidase [Rikenellaceae bacterium]